MGTSLSSATTTASKLRSHHYSISNRQYELEMISSQVKYSKFGPNNAQLAHRKLVYETSVVLLLLRQNAKRVALRKPSKAMMNYLTGTHIPELRRTAAQLKEIVNN